MIGPILIVIVLLVALPVGIIMLAGIGSVLFGAALNKNSDELHADHELRPLNK